MALLDEAEGLARETGDVLGVAMVSACRGFAVLDGLKDAALATALGEESLALFREADAPWGVTASRMLLARAAQQQGDANRAEALYEQLLTDFREHGGDAYVAAHTLHNLGSFAQTRGDHARALSFFSEALVRFNDLGDLGSVAWCLEGVATVGGRDHPEQAARLFAAADALRTAIDVPLPPAERAEYDQAVGRVRAALGEPAFNVAWQAGAVLPRDAALAEARDLARLSN